MLGQDGKTSVHELDMHPVNQQGSLAQLNERTESQLRRTPAAPGITRCQNHQQHAYAEQPEVRAGVPIIVDGVKLMRLGVEPARGRYEH